MSKKMLPDTHPELLIYEVPNFNPMGGVVLCRAYADNDTLVRPGVFCYLANVDGCSVQLTIELRDRAMLRLPGENDARRETFDRLMQTRFVALHYQSETRLTVPFIATQRDAKIATCKARIALNYRRLIDDPGFVATRKESEWLEFLTGKSDFQSFSSKAKKLEFQEGDRVPVSFEVDGQETLGIISLSQEVGLNCFDCEFSVDSRVADHLETGAELDRVVHMKQLNQQNGEMEEQVYSKSFGTVTLLA